MLEDIIGGFHLGVQTHLLPSLATVQGIVAFVKPDVWHDVVLSLVYLEAASIFACALEHRDMRSRIERGWDTMLFQEYPEGVLQRYAQKHGQLYEFEQARDFYEEERDPFY